MPSLTLENLSESLYELLQQQAEANRSTIDSEAIVALARGVREPRAFGGAPPTVEEIRAFRESLTCQPLTQDFIEAAIGRRRR
jgi:hypothetical protein